MTRPANTVGGDFYDIMPLPDGRVLLALGDVAGKGSPAALLMALLLAMLRTLVDEGLEGAALMSAAERRRSPSTRRARASSRCSSPRSTRRPASSSTSTPARTRRCCAAAAGGYERLRDGGIALGMFEHATYVAARTLLDAGDVLVLYSDGITEAEDGRGHPFDEVGLAADRRCAPDGLRRRSSGGPPSPPSSGTPTSRGCSTT